MFGFEDIELPRYQMYKDSIEAKLAYNLIKGEEYIETSIVGSSEVCMLGGMAMKFRWRDKANKAGVDTIDDYTIGAVGILGITYTDRYDDIEKLDAAIEKYNQTAKITVPIHVDGVSGGLFAPFVQEDLKCNIYKYFRA